MTTPAEKTAKPKAPQIVNEPLADSKHHSKGRIKDSRPRFIVLHSTVGTDSRDWLSTTSPMNSPVSIHALIAKDGTIYRIVRDEDTAYHAGHAYIGPYGPNRESRLGINTNSLGIELENMNSGKDPYPDAQVYACAWQVAEWWKKYGHLPIEPHGLIDARKSDPAGFPWPAFYKHLAALI